jgi:hypothetical protein
MLAVLTLCLLGAEPLDTARWVALPVEERRARIVKLSVDERKALITKVPFLELLALEKKAAVALGTYSVTMASRERLDGVLSPRQTVRMWVQPDPFAVRVKNLAGPGEGRRLLYNASLRKDQLHVNQPGVVGAVGGVWIDVKGSIARGGSNHLITDTGLVALVELVTRHSQEAMKEGELTRTFEYVDESGAVCERFDSPKTTKVLYATSSRLCVDPVTMLPVSVEITDAGGLLEVITFSDVKSQPALGKKFFTLDGPEP